MGSKPIRAVPAQSFSVRGSVTEEDEADLLVHSCSDGSVCYV
jgi:hypothetical protein